MSSNFSRKQAFARNIGWVTPDEQTLLATKRVAIAGLGGVGGSHLLTLARLGVGRFTLADPDTFELVNFNRQAGAILSTLGKPKVSVLAAMAREINPEIELDTYSIGVDSTNAARFLDGADLYVDGLDFFAFDARRAVFARCAERRIPATTAAPMGMGAALLNFLPGGMTFEEYFRLEGHNEEEMAIRFLVGLCPAMLQRPYLVFPDAVDLGSQRGPSTSMACELCAGIVGTEALKILLGRKHVVAAPRGVQFDAYRNMLRVTWRPGGNHHPLQRLAIRIARRMLSKRRSRRAK